MDAEAHQIAATQLAVDGEVEQREFLGSMIQLQSNSDGSDFFQLTKERLMGYRRKDLTARKAKKRPLD